MKPGNMRLQQQSRFILEIDKLKQVLRQTLLIDQLLHNYHTQAGTWKQPGVTLDKVMARTRAISLGSSSLGEFADSLIQDALKQGFL